MNASNSAAVVMEGSKFVGAAEDDFWRLGSITRAAVDAKGYFGVVLNLVGAFNFAGSAVVFMGDSRFVGDAVTCTTVDEEDSRVCQDGQTDGAVPLLLGCMGNFFSLWENVAGTSTCTSSSGSSWWIPFRCALHLSESLLCVRGLLASGEDAWHLPGISHCFALFLNAYCCWSNTAQVNLDVGSKGDSSRKQPFVTLASARGGLDWCGASV